LPAAASFLAVEPADRVTLTVAKPADDGKGVIARLRETSGQQTEAVLTVRFPGAIRASLCDLVERVVEPLVLTDGQVKVPLRANGMATIRLEWDRPLTAAR
jgi:alpha-mannosidase